MSSTPPASGRDEKVAAITELIEAAEAVAVYLYSSYDQPAATTLEIKPTGAARLRMEADRLEQKDEAIYRFRRALAAIKEAS